MSSNTAEESVEPAVEKIERPKVPHPTASSIEVEAFLAQFFRALNNRLPPSEAKERAQKFKEVDGKALYELPEKQFIEKFGSIAGATIFNQLHISKYGYGGSIWYWLTVVGGILSILGLFSGGLQLYTEKEQRDWKYSTGYIFTVVFLILVHAICTSEYIIDWQGFPERLKIRRGSAPAESWTPTRWLGGSS